MRTLTNMFIAVLILVAAYIPLAWWGYYIIGSIVVTYFATLLFNNGDDIDPTHNDYITDGE